MFGKFGLKKTSIAQLTEAAGISPAAFYKFFGSKEELYFLIFEQSAHSLQSLMLEQLANRGSNSLNASFQKTFLTILHRPEEDPFMAQLFSGSDFKQLLLHLPQTDIDSHVLMGYRNFSPIFENLQKEGKLIAVDPKVLVTIMQLFFLLNEQRSHFDDAIFDQAMLLLAGWIAQGFTDVGAGDLG